MTRGFIRRTRLVPVCWDWNRARRGGRRFGGLDIAESGDEGGRRRQRRPGAVRGLGYRGIQGPKSWKGGTDEGKEWVGPGNEILLGSSDFVSSFASGRLWAEGWVGDVNGRYGSWGES